MSQIDRYLERIGYGGDRTPNAANLRALQRAHLYAVPFENLDIGWGNPIALEHDALYDKIVTRQRGGFCYELNGLFAWVLGELGYKVANLSASDAHEDGTYGPAFDHLVLRVRCPAGVEPEVDWLVDVGWGDTFRDPLRLVPAIEQPEEERTYWLAPVGDCLILHQRDWDGYEERQYAFTLEEFPFEAYASMCVYQQTSPDSHFTKQRIITLANPTGRVTLRNNRMTLTAGHERTSSEFTESDFPALLMQHFGIAAPSSSQRALR